MRIRSGAEIQLCGSADRLSALDERMGYTGDGQVFARTGAYNFDTNDFWKNFLRDLELGQLDNTEGYVCATVPQTGPAGIGFISMLGWGNAVTILPEMLYQQFETRKHCHASTRA